MKGGHQRGTLLVCEDDELTLAMLCDNLAADQYRVLPAPAAADALRIAGHQRPDLMLLDLGLPDASGLDVLRAIRNEEGSSDPFMPIILFSGLGSEQDRIRCLESGADDFIVKPFPYPELLARIRAVMRRCRRQPGESLRVGGLVVDRVTRQVTVDGQEIDLNRKEYRMLCILAEQPERIFTKDELLFRIWGHDSRDHSRTLESHASRLRRKLDPVDRRFVINAWGVGYKLVEES